MATMIWMKRHSDCWKEGNLPYLTGLDFQAEFRQHWPLRAQWIRERHVVERDVALHSLRDNPTANGKQRVPVNHFENARSRADCLHDVSVHAGQLQIARAAQVSQNNGRSFSKRAANHVSRQQTKQPKPADITESKLQCHTIVLV